jgi:uncharacterized protein
MRGTTATAILCALLAMLAGCDTPSATGQLTIAANPAGTNTYAVAAGMAKVLQENTGVRATIRPFSGSSVYIPMLQRGEITMGLNTAVDTYLAFNGLPPYSEPAHNLRLLMVGLPLYIMYMVDGASDIHSVEDLRGRRVIVTMRANAGLEYLHRGILATGGLTEQDIDSITVAGLPDGVRLLIEGRVDAVSIGIDTALGLQAHSSLSGGVRFITLGHEEARLADFMPAANIVTVTPDMFEVGVNEPLRVPEIDDYLNTSVTLDEADAYKIVKALHEHWDTLARDYPQLGAMSEADIAPPNPPHPYHPGAVRYLKEAGLWTDAHERHQTAVLAVLAEPERSP